MQGELYSFLLVVAEPNYLLLRRKAKKHNPGTLKALRREFKKYVICTTKSPHSHIFCGGFILRWKRVVMQLAGQGKRSDGACPAHTNLSELKLLITVSRLTKLLYTIISEFHNSFRN